MSKCWKLTKPANRWWRWWKPRQLTLLISYPGSRDSGVVDVNWGSQHNQLSDEYVIVEGRWWASRAEGGHGCDVLFLFSKDFLIPAVPTAECLLTTAKDIQQIVQCSWFFLWLWSITDEHAAMQMLPVLYTLNSLCWEMQCKTDRKSSDSSISLSSSGCLSTNQ